jgi:hypothetical protein
MFSSTRRIAGVLAVLAVAMLSGCATITQGSSQTVTVDTRPTGAACALSRGGDKFAVINPTPGTISVDKSSKAISVSCTKEGYQESAGVLESFQAMTFGNIIFGGLIGVAVDAASGAMNKYPPMVTLTLIPAEFKTSKDRDAFFDAMKAEFNQEAEKVEQRIRDQCKSTNDCESQMKAAKAAEEARLADIEKRRLLAKVATP